MKMKVRPTLRLLLAVSVAVLLICLLNILLPSHHLNSDIAIVSQESPQQQRFIGRVVLGQEANARENTTSQPANQQQTTEKHSARKRPQIHNFDANASWNATIKRKQKYFLGRPEDIAEAVMNNNSPCVSMEKQARREFLESLNAEKRSMMRDMGGQPHLTKPRLKGYSPLSEEDMETIEAFVFFVGWQRSGHSIIGSLLDGHPNVVIAHEFLLFTHLHEFTSKKLSQRLSRARLFNQLVANSFRNARYGDRSILHNEKGYNLKLAGSWQGCYQRLRFLGDKAAGEVTNMYRKNTTNFIRHLRRLQSLVDLPLKVINVIRNPYDMIATLSLYRGSPIIDVKVPASVKDKYSNRKVIREAADIILVKAHFLYMMLQEGYDWDLIQIHSEDFIRHPTSTMRDLCTFLGLECSEGYLQMCAEKTFKATSKSRELIEWDPVIMERVEESIHEIPFFRRYSFNSD